MCRKTILSDYFQLFADEHSLLKRRQIRDSKACATATAYLLRRVVETSRTTDVSRLIERVQQVGQKLVLAQRKEVAIGNIVRRVLGVIREEAEEDREGETSAYGDPGTDSRPQLPRDHDSRALQPPILFSRTLASSPLRGGGADQTSEIGTGEESQQPPLLTSHAVGNNVLTATSMFSLLSQPKSRAASPAATPGSQFPGSHPKLSNQALADRNAAKDLRAEVVEGIQEILEEVNQADDQIAGYAPEYIHSNEIILTHASSVTVQKFLLKAAGKRKFTVIHAEGYPNNHEATHSTVIGKVNGEPDDELVTELFQKSLAEAGITVILIPDSAVFAMMSRVNKVILDTHAVLANGSLVSAAGARAITKAASLHRTPVVVLSGIYKLSPVYPFDIDVLMEDGDPSNIFRYEDGDLVEKIEVANPFFDHVPADLVTLYITNLYAYLLLPREVKALIMYLRGGHTPSNLYSVVKDHYRAEDIELGTLEA